jgi:adenosylcobinamide kinase/adenosylcobinamide-phosphate guanylyltransferase
LACTLILGGARSGKTRYALAQAQDRAGQVGGRLVMIATAQALDAEMEDRIARHRVERGSAWTTVEALQDLARALDDLSPEDVAVVDCLTLWLSNVLDAPSVEAEVAGLVAAVARCKAQLFLVSNEVGWGIVPDNALARRFRDEAGRLHQALAETVGGVVLVVAGLPLRLKG